MKNKVIKELEHLYEKERYDFLGKYYLVEKDYSESDLTELKEYIDNLIYRMEKIINSSDDVYNFLNYDEDAYDYSSSYIYGNDGLQVYNLYYNFLHELRVFVDIALEEADEEEYSADVTAKKVIETVKNAYSIIEASSHTSLKIDPKFAEKELFDMLSPIAKGACFFDEDCNEVLNAFIADCRVKDIVEVEFSGEESEDDIQEMLAEYTTKKENIVVIIFRNLGDALTPNLLGNLLSLFHNFNKHENVRILISSENAYELDSFKELAKIKFFINKENCFYNL